MRFRHVSRGKTAHSEKSTAIPELDQGLPQAKTPTA
jgi:hypothetical protein